MKDIPDPANLGCPIAEIHQDGRLIIGKTRNCGGRVSEQTVKEQLLYEVHDPRRYSDAGRGAGPGPGPCTGLGR